MAKLAAKHPIPIDFREINRHAEMIFDQWLALPQLEYENRH